MSGGIGGIFQENREKFEEKGNFWGEIGRNLKRREFFEEEREKFEEKGFFLKK